MNMKQYAKPRVGLFGIGLEAYWSQFDGLKDRLEGYLSEVNNNLLSLEADVVNIGLVDNPEKAFDAGHKFRKEDVDIIFLYVSTYALSSTVLPVVKRAKVPVIILNLAPEKAIDYEKFNKLGSRTQMTAEWLAYCSACPVPEIASVFKRTGINFHQITGVLNNDDKCWSEVSEWIEAAKVANIMFHNRMGCMGHYYGGMLDIYSDLTQHNAHFGGHFEMIEVDQLSALRRDVSEQNLKTRLEEFGDTFDIDPSCPQHELEEAARTSIALDKLVEKFGLGSMAYFYSGTGNKENEATINSIILGNSLLTSRGIPVAGEYEIKNAQAMKIMDIFGAGGSFTEYYAMDFNDDVIIMGHDGPGHIGIAEGKIKAKPLEVFHGKVGKGLSVEMSIKHGPVTLLAVVQKEDGKLMLLTAEGESVPGAILEIGNTNSRYSFQMGVREFINSWNNYGPAHHCAVGTGHISSKISKLGSLLEMEVANVC